MLSDRHRLILTALLAAMQLTYASSLSAEFTPPYKFTDAYKPPQEFDEGMRALVMEFPSQQRKADEKEYGCAIDRVNKDVPVLCGALVTCGTLQISLKEDKPVDLTLAFPIEWSALECTEDLFIRQTAAVLKNILGIEQSAAVSKTTAFQQHASRGLIKQHRVNSFGPESKVEAIGNVLPLAGGRAIMTVSRADLDQWRASRGFLWSKTGQLEWVEKHLEKLR